MSGISSQQKEGSSKKKKKKKNGARIEKQKKVKPHMKKLRVSKGEKNRKRG
jgi:hypothetical protein